LVRDEESMRMLGEWKHERTKTRKARKVHQFVSFALSNFRVSKPLELNPHDDQGVRFLLRDLDEGLSWEESVARDERNV